MAVTIRRPFGGVSLRRESDAKVDTEVRVKTVTEQDIFAASA